MGSGSTGDRVSQSFDWQKVSPCVAVIETIELYDQTRLGTSDGLEKPLGSYFKVDVLDDLVPTGIRMTISFDIEDYSVTIHEHSVFVTATGAEHHAE